MNLKLKLNSLINKSTRRKQLKSRGKKTKNKSSRLAISWKPVAVIVSLILVIGLFTGYIIPVFKSLSTFELKRDSSDGARETEVWNGSERLIVLSIGLDAIGEEHKFVDALVLYVVDPQTGSLGIFAIDPDFDIKISGLTNELNIRTLYNLAEAEGREVEIITRAVENLLAVSIDRYVIVDENQFNSVVEFIGPVQVELDQTIKDPDVAEKITKEPIWIEGSNWIYADEYLAYLASDDLGRNDQLNRTVDLFSKLVKGFDSYQVLIKLPRILNQINDNVKTNISNWELVTLFRTLSGIRSDQIRRGYTRSDSSIHKGIGGIYPRLQPVTESIDNDLESILYDFNIAKEQARIEILNGSGIAGMASSRARWVRNTGGRVVHFGNSIEKYEETTVYVDDPELYPQTLREIERIFNNKITYADAEYKYRHIGDIIIVIGKNVD